MAPPIHAPAAAAPTGTVECDESGGDDLIWIVGAALMLIGLLGYSGLWRSWAKGGLSYWVFGLFWFGLGIVLVSIVLALPARPSWLFWIPAVIALLGAGSTWYLPPALTPRWFRALRSSWR